MTFVVLVVAFALAPGLIAGDLAGISTFPAYFEEDPIRSGSLIPLPLPIPDSDPVSPEVLPDSIEESNPCDACFEHISSLIEQLTEHVEPEVELQPHPMPEVPVLPVPNPGGSLGVGPRPLGSL